MSIKISHSGVDLYKTCNRKYYLQNIERIIPTNKSSSLVIGTAFDQAFNDILMNHEILFKNGKLDEETIFEIGLDAFNRSWEKQTDRYLGEILLAKNPNIIYTKKDLEEGVLQDSDGTLIEAYFDELLPELQANIEGEYPFETGYHLFQHLKELHRNFQYFTEPDKKLYNYVCWLSVKRKAPFIIRAYVEELVPHIDKVVSVQTDLSTTSEDGDILAGVADFVVQLKPGTYNGVEVKAGENCIADNKTSGKLYARDTVEKSSQLSKYKHILNNDHKMNVEKGAYLVVLKELKQVKNKTCTSCGYKTVSQAKTCDQKINKKRCGGEWSTDISYHAVTQLVVDVISPETEEMSMLEVDQTIQDIKEGKFDPSFDKCDWQYGSPCAYRDLCSNGSMRGLVKVEKK